MLENMRLGTREGNQFEDVLQNVCNLKFRKVQKSIVGKSNLIIFCVGQD